MAGERGGTGERDRRTDVIMEQDRQAGRAGWTGGRKRRDGCPAYRREDQQADWRIGKRVDERLVGGWAGGGPLVSR